MAIRFDNNKLIIELPNSEATINAQHNGIKDRTGLHAAFKMKLQPQEASLGGILYLIKTHDDLYKIDNPSINDQRKYIKFPSLDFNINNFKDVCIGDLTYIVFEKIGIDTFLIYAEDNNRIDELLKNKIVLKWMS